MNTSVDKCTVGSRNVQYTKLHFTMLCLIVDEKIGAGIGLDKAPIAV